MNNWKYAFYCQKGINHGVCQDFADVYADNKRVIACLCDGLGSLKNSDIAAQETVKSVIGLFRSLPNAPTPQTNLARFRKKLVDELQKRLRAVAAERDMAPESMDCTLVFACLFLDKSMAMIGCLGDSALCVIRDDKAPQLFCDSGFIGTRAVLDDDAAEHLQCIAFPLDGHVKSILLASDGLENEIYYKGLPHVAKNTELYLNAMLRDDPQKIMQARIEELTAAEDTVFDDDISVAVLSSLERPVRLADEPTWPCLCGAENLLVDTFCSECSRDFLDMYQHIDFKGDRAGFFRYIRRNPAAKQALMTSIAEGTPFCPPLNAKPAQRQPEAPPPRQKLTGSRAPEPAAPQKAPPESPAPEPTVPQSEAQHAPQHIAHSAKKRSLVTAAIVAAAVVLCAALLTALIMVLVRQAQDAADQPSAEAQQSEMQETTGRREKKPENSGGVNQAEPGESTAPSTSMPQETTEPTFSGGGHRGRSGVSAYPSDDDAYDEDENENNPYPDDGFYLIIV